MDFQHAHNSDGDAESASGSSGNELSERKRKENIRIGLPTSPFAKIVAVDEDVEEEGGGVGATKKQEAWEEDGTDEKGSGKPGGMLAWSSFRISIWLIRAHVDLRSSIPVYVVLCTDWSSLGGVIGPHRVAAASATAYSSSAFYRALARIRSCLPPTMNVARISRLLPTYTNLRATASWPPTALEDAVGGAAQEAVVEHELRQERRSLAEEGRQPFGEWPEQASADSRKEPEGPKSEVPNYER